MDWTSQVFLGNPLKNYAYFVGIVLASVIIGKNVEWVLEKVFKRLVRRTKSKFDDIVIEEVSKVIFHVFIVLGIFVASFSLNITDTIRDYYVKLIKILFIFVFIKFIISLWDNLVENVIKQMVMKTESDLDDILLPVLNKAVKIVIIVMVIIMVMSELGFNVMSFVAGLGIGGLALAFASKDFIANLFGAFSIYSERMFMLGDKIKVKGEEGEVVDIGLRSTKLKKKDGSIVIIPNLIMTSNPVVILSHGKKRKSK